MGTGKKKRGRKPKQKDDEVEYVSTREPEPVEPESAEPVEPESAEPEPQVQAEQEQLIDTDILNATTAELNEEDPQLELNEEELEGEVTPNDAEKGLIDEEPEGEIQFSEDHDNIERKSKRQRGPTCMKDIAKDPNTRVHVEFNSLGEIYGKGSVKMASYVGALVREHVPITFDHWTKITEEIRTLL